MPEVMDDPSLAENNQEDLELTAELPASTEQGAPPVDSGQTEIAPTAQQAAPAAGTPPMPWKDVKAYPEFQALSPDQQKGLFTRWVSNATSYLSDVNTPRPALNQFRDNVLQEGKNLGVGFIFNPDGTPQTLGQRNALLGMTTPPETAHQPFTMAIEPSTIGNAAEQLGTGIRQGLTSLFTRTLPGAEAKVWDYVTGTAPSDDLLNAGLAVPEQLEKENAASQEGLSSKALGMGTGIGNFVATLSGGAKFLNMALAGSTMAADSTYHNALDQGATPAQAAASAGVAATVSAASLRVLAPLSAISAKLGLGENAEAFLAGAYRPTVMEASKLLGLDAAGLFGVGATGQIIQNKADQNLYDPTRSTTAGALDAGAQMSLFSLIHAPTMLKAFWDNRSTLSAAGRDRSNALVALDSAHAEGDPIKIKVAEEAYAAASGAFEDTVNETAKNAPDPTPQDAQEAKDLVAKNPAVSNPLDAAIADATQEAQKPSLPVVGEEAPLEPIEEKEPDVQTETEPTSTTEPVPEVPPAQEQAVEPGAAAEPESGATAESASVVAGEPESKGTAPATHLGDQEQAGGKPPIPLYQLHEDIPGHPAGSTVSGETLTNAGYDLPDTKPQADLRSRIMTALGAKAPKTAKIVFSKDHLHPAWADPAQPGKIFVNPDALTETLGHLDEGFKDTAHGDEYLRRLMAQKTGEEIIHNAQHQVRGQTNHAAIHDATPEAERKKTIERYGNDSIDASKATSPEDAANRKVAWVEEHARQILQRKANGETTEDVWKQGDKTALVRYFQALYQKIRAHISAFGDNSELGKYLKNIEGVLADAEKAGQKIDKGHVSGAPNPIHQAAHFVRDMAESKRDEYLKDVDQSGKDIGLTLPEGVEKTAVKTKESLDRKLGTKKGKVPSDLLRTTLISQLSRDSLHGQVIDLIQNMSEKGYRLYAPQGETDVLSRHIDPKGYADIALKFVKEGDPIVRELQILQPEMYKAKQNFHSLYEEARVLPEGSPERQKLENQMGDLYSEAYAKDNDQSNLTPSESRKTPLESGRANIQSPSSPLYPKSSALLSAADFSNKASDFASDDPRSATELGLAAIERSIHKDSTSGRDNRQVDGISYPDDTSKLVGSQVAFAAVPKLEEADKPVTLDKDQESKWQSTKSVFKKFAREQLTDLKAYTPRLKATMVYLRKIAQKIQNSNEVRDYIRKALPDTTTRGAVIRWIEAGGNKEVLAKQAEATDDPKLKSYYEAAQDLSPDQEAMANKVVTLLEAYRQKAEKWGLQINKRANYFPHVVERDPNQALFGTTSNRLKTAFNHMGERTYPTMFDGEQAGVKYKTNDAADGVAAYLNDLDHAIASRQYIADLSKGKESDGRSMIAPPKSGFSDLTPPKGGTVHLVFNGAPPEGMEDYQSIPEIRALRNWAWAGDANGATVMHQSDMLVHPQTAAFLKKIFGTSGISAWWKSPSATASEAIWKRGVKFLFNDLNAIAKSNLFAFSPFFHPIQIGVEAAGHGVMPTRNIGKLDLNDPEVADAMDHSLALGHEDSKLNEEARSDTNKTLLRPVEILADKLGGERAGDAVRWVKDANQAAQDWIFKTYIPSIKYNTYKVALERNRDRLSKDLESGKVTEDQVKYLTAEQVNNAYGELNYAALERHPDVQLMMRNFLLAPDFFEARARHLGQAVSGIAQQSGREQFRAIASVGLAFAVSAQMTNILLNGEMDLTHPFEPRIGNRYYGMRSSPGDALNLFKDACTLITGGTRGVPYVNNRMSPMFRFLDELRTGTNWRGEKVGAAGAITDFIANNSPMMVQPFASKVPIMGQFFTSSKNNPVSPFEQVLSALGVKVSRYSPITEMSIQARDWVAKHGDEVGLKEDNTVYPVSKYRALKYALEDGDDASASQQYQTLLDGEKGNAQKVSSGFGISLHHPFTGSTKGDQAFFKSLDAHDQAMFKAALDRKQVLLQRFQQMRSSLNKSN